MAVTHTHVCLKVHSAVSACACVFDICDMQISLCGHVEYVCIDMCECANMCDYKCVHMLECICVLGSMHVDM